jgi:hypothetical protein
LLRFAGGEPKGLGTYLGSPVDRSKRLASVGIWFIGLLCKSLSSGEKLTTDADQLPTNS